MGLSIGFRSSISLLPAIQATGLLAVALAGLPPAERASLWLDARNRFCGFHGAVICIAIFGIAHDRADRGGCCTLAGVPIVVPRGLLRSFWIGGPVQPLRDSPASTLPRETHGFTSSRPRRASRCGPWCASCVVRT